MTTVPLTKGYVAIVDDSDAKSIIGYRWHADVRRHTVYASTSVTVLGKRRELRLHTFLTGLPRVDHRDGNGLNNRRSNLRACTQKQNVWNTRSHSQRIGGNGGKGVTKIKRLRLRPWQARLSVDGLQKHLGYFPTKEEAEAAYDVAAMLNYGEFANLNGSLATISDNRLRTVITRQRIPDPNSRGSLLLYSLSCGHTSTVAWYRRPKIGNTSHCKECKSS